MVVRLRGPRPVRVFPAPLEVRLLLNYDLEQATEQEPVYEVPVEFPEIRSSAMATMFNRTKNDGFGLKDEQVEVKTLSLTIEPTTGQAKAVTVELGEKIVTFDKSEIEELADKFGELD
jgi:hypothetical protein